MLWHSWLSYFVCIFDTQAVLCRILDFTMPAFSSWNMVNTPGDLAVCLTVITGAMMRFIQSWEISVSWITTFFYQQVYINFDVHWSSKSLQCTVYLHIYFWIGFGFVNGTLSWQEQRNFTNLGLEALGNHTLATEIVHQLGLIQAKQPNMSGENQIRQVYTKHV